MTEQPKDDDAISAHVDAAAIDAFIDHRCAQPTSGQPFQSRVLPWIIACFGEQIAGDKIERNHRFLEEALELAQSCDCTRSEAHQLVDYVFGRDVGEKTQELGGVMVTLAALSLAHGLDMDAAAETELARIWTKCDAIRAKQAAKPKHSPLPQHSAQPASQLAERDAVIGRLRAALKTISGMRTGNGDPWGLIDAMRNCADAALSPPIAAKQDEPSDHEAYGAMIYRGKHEARTNNGGDDEDVTLIEKIAQIIDPEAWGLSNNIEDGTITDRDEARDRARLIIVALSRPQPVAAASIGIDELVDEARCRPTPQEPSTEPSPFNPLDHEQTK